MHCLPQKTTYRTRFNVWGANLLRFQALQNKRKFALGSEPPLGVAFPPFKFIDRDGNWAYVVLPFSGPWAPPHTQPAQSMTTNGHEIFARIQGDTNE
jgi:hypothetical protein